MRCMQAKYTFRSAQQCRESNSSANPVRKLPQTVHVGQRAVEEVARREGHDAAVMPRTTMAAEDRLATTPVAAFPAGTNAQTSMALRAVEQRPCGMNTPALHAGAPRPLANKGCDAAVSIRHDAVDDAGARRLFGSGGAMSWNWNQPRRGPAGPRNGDWLWRVSRSGHLEFLVVGGYQHSVLRARHEARPVRHFASVTDS
jgi:hypothetical protein